MMQKLFWVILAIAFPPAVVLAHGIPMNFVWSLVATDFSEFFRIIHAFWIMDERHVW
jgi:uncharacterized membrane protein YqaE (UPF0057 family)